MVTGHILLEGGAEFGGRMAEPDLRAIELAGGFDAPITILPTAAAPDHNDRRAGGNGVRWFESLGARRVTAPPLIDIESANRPEIAHALEESGLIYLLGGFPAYLARTLAGSRSWQAVLDAYHGGAVIGGSSAGAMVLCENLYDPYSKELLPGLNLIPGACVIPHHNTFGQDWAAFLTRQIPDHLLIGIDERTGMIDDGPNGHWNVYGHGSVTLYRQGKAETFTPQDFFSL